MNVEVGVGKTTVAVVVGVRQVTGVPVATGVTVVGTTVGVGGIAAFVNIVVTTFDPPVSQSAAAVTETVRESPGV
jgi:hypothetical protein